MYERTTERARRVLILAQEEARARNAGSIGTQHLLLGLIREEHGVGAIALNQLGVDLETVQTVIGPPQNPVHEQDALAFSSEAKHVLELALREALQLGHNYVGTEHILLGLAREAKGFAATILIDHGVDLARARQTIIDLLCGYAQQAEPVVPGTPEPVVDPAHLTLLRKLLSHTPHLPTTLITSLNPAEREILFRVLDDQPGGS